VKNQCRRLLLLVTSPLQTVLLLPAATESAKAEVLDRLETRSAAGQGVTSCSVGLVLVELGGRVVVYYMGLVAGVSGSHVGFELFEALLLVWGSLRVSQL
jgi:hypothetical protein